MHLQVMTTLSTQFARTAILACSRLSDPWVYKPRQADEGSVLFLAGSYNLIAFATIVCNRHVRGATPPVLRRDALASQRLSWLRLMDHSMVCQMRALAHLFRLTRSNIRIPSRCAHHRFVTGSLTSIQGDSATRLANVWWRMHIKVYTGCSS